MKPAERGNGTVLSLALMFAIGAAGFVVLAQGQAVIATHAVQDAADLTAIAAAQAVADPCTKADAVAKANRVRLLDCTAEAADYVVRVESDLPSLIAHVLDLLHVQPSPIRASARAGMVQELDGDLEPDHRDAYGLD